MSIFSLQKVRQERGCNSYTVIFCVYKGFCPGGAERKKEALQKLIKKVYPLKPPVETGRELEMHCYFHRNRLCEWYQWVHAWCRLITVHIRVWFLSW